MMNKRDFLKKMGATSLGVAAATAIPVVADAAKKATKSRVLNNADRRRNRIPNVPLMTHEGEAVMFYDDLVKDKTVMINFMYARCADSCPGTTQNLKKVQNELGDRVGKDIFMYSISLDSEHDTPESLKAYAELFKTKPGWKFLTGKKEDIEKLRRSLGFVNDDPELDKDRTLHTGMVKFGIESLERWGSAPSMTNPKYLAEYVRWLEPNGKKPNLAEMMG